MKATSLATTLALSVLSTAAVAEPLTLTADQMDEVTAGVAFDYHPGYAQDYQRQAYHYDAGVFRAIEGEFTPGTDYPYDQVYFAVPYLFNDQYAYAYYGARYVYAYVPYLPQGYVSATPYTGPAYPNYYGAAYPGS
jgi:hypothetical protein